jgi:hypothetical protein
MWAYNGSTGWAYAWSGGEVRPENWDAESFRRQHLQEYAARCARIASTLAVRADC